MKTIAVITTTRADYGLLKNIMHAINKSPFLSLKLIISGTHLSEKFGLTINEIKNDGFTIDEVCPILLDGDSKDKNAKEISISINKFSTAFSKLSPDIILILGDRYEILAAAITALTMNIAIAHISGGEITEGAIDDQIRHAITKMAHLHFPATSLYKENILKMGEEAFRVFDVGDPGIENIRLSNLLSKKQINDKLDLIIDDNTLLVTYHPVTLEINDLKKQINNLLISLDKLDNTIIITYPNSDNGSDIIISQIEEFSNRKKNVHIFKNLGSLMYLSVAKHCGAIVGNSSSGIVEGPYLKNPVINIGNRQKGRLLAKNIINVSNDSSDIDIAIKTALSKDFKDFCKTVKSLYGDGNTSSQIVEVFCNIKIDESFLKKKLFWSL